MQQIQILEGPNLEVWSSLVLLHSSTYVQKFVSLTMNRGFHQQFKDDESQYCIIVQGPDPVSEDLLSVHSHDPRAEDCLLCPVNNVQEASAEYLTIVTQNFLGSELTNSEFGIRHDDTRPVSTESAFFFYDSLSGPVVSSSDENISISATFDNLKLNDPLANAVNLPSSNPPAPPLLQLPTSPWRSRPSSPSSTYSFEKSPLWTMDGEVSPCSPVPGFARGPDTLDDNERSPSVSSFASEGYFIDPGRGRGSSVVSDASESSSEHIDPRFLGPDIQSSTICGLPFCFNSQGSESDEGQIQHTQVATKKTRIASEKRRKKGARFHCKVPGCHGSFTAKHNLIMHSLPEEIHHECRVESSYSRMLSQDLGKIASLDRGNQMRISIQVFILVSGDLVLVLANRRSFNASFNDLSVLRFDPSMLRVTNVYVVASGGSVLTSEFAAHQVASTWKLSGAIIV
ncbi:hypothetical protein F5877DRAFT_66154 [Lentinula edodes]|nr:hypothetical protein F5877DRAFT_66154 [Lentinula edodes]